MHVLKNIIFFLLALFFTLNVLAHHSGEMFDDDITVTLSGVVKEFRYINPHSWLIVDIYNED